jgi:hypothetical protein
LDVNPLANFAIDGVGGVVYDLAQFADMLTTSFKSPNVYEIVVPGRFRWLWCTMSMKVSNVGKIYNDKVEIGRHPVFSGDASLIGFPEAYKVELTVTSLLPQSYNEWCYFVMDQDLKGSVTDKYKREYDEKKRQAEIKKERMNYIANSGIDIGRMV